MSPSQGLQISELMNAIDSGNYNQVVSILNSNSHLIHAQDDHYGTPLHRAAIKGQAEIAALLVSKGANVKARKRKHASTPLHYTAQMGQLEIVELLISKGAGVNVRDYEGAIPFDSACYGGSFKAVQRLKRAGGKSGGQSLHNAVFSGCKELVVYLLDGWSVDKRWTQGDCKGETALHQAAFLNRTDIAMLLITRGANVNARDSRNSTPLHHAAGDWDESVGATIRSNFPIVDAGPMVDLLVKSGADVAAKDKKGRTPLDVAIGNQNASATLALDKHGENRYWRRRETGPDDSVRLPPDGLSANLNSSRGTSAVSASADAAEIPLDSDHCPRCGCLLTNAHVGGTLVLRCRQCGYRNPPGLPE